MEGRVRPMGLVFATCVLEVSHIPWLVAPSTFKVSSDRSSVVLNTIPLVLTLLLLSSSFVKMWLHCTTHIISNDMFTLKLISNCSLNYPLPCSMIYSQFLWRGSECLWGKGHYGNVPSITTPTKKYFLWRQMMVGRPVNKGYFNNSS